MSINHNGHGRSYALCDGPDGCPSNIIDLPLNVEQADRIARTFFLWRNIGENRHLCDACMKKEKQNAPQNRTSRRRYNRGWTRHIVVTTSGAGDNPADDSAAGTPD